MEAKKIAAETAADYITDGMTVGLGTGSTAYWAIVRLGRRVREGLNIRAVATSISSERLAAEQGIRLTSLSEVDGVDITIDGADEIDPAWHLIKGGGGALLREKIVAASSKRLIVIVDESKLVPHLGRFPLPVEIVPFGHAGTIDRLQQLGCVPKLRMAEQAPFVTDNGNYIADCAFGRIEDPAGLQLSLNVIPGVVDNGLFVDLAAQVIVGYRDGTVKQLSKPEQG